MYRPLKATSLLGRQTGSLCIRISSLLLCTELGEMPCIQSSRRIPPPRRLFSSHKQPFNQREKRVENEKCARPWMIQNISISVDSDHHLCCQNNVHWGQCTPPLSFFYFLTSNSSALELVLWSFGSHLAQYDWSSYHLTPPYTPNIYRPIDTLRRNLHNLTHGNDFN